MSGRDAVAASTWYRCVAVGPRAALLALAPRTGRTHQLRVHAAHAGAPLLGDRVYGGASSLTIERGDRAGAVLTLRRVALHAARIRVPDRDGAPLEIVSPVPAELDETWRTLGGAPEAWDTALSCVLDPSFSRSPCW